MIAEKHLKWTLKQAEVSDVPEIQLVRNAVKENQLSNPLLVSDEDCVNFITKRGKGWVGLFEGTIVGFAIVDLKENNVWALFVHPDFEGFGIGKKLHDTMVSWYFKQCSTPLVLGTEPGTRAVDFYKKSGWILNGWYSDDELKFEMTMGNWQKLKE